MKFLVSLLLLVPLFSIAGNEKTVENLKSAFREENMAASRYTAYADQARREGLSNLASMFDAVSRAAGIHASNFRTVLEKLGEKTDAVKPGLKTGTTVENLEEAIRSETEKSSKTYPAYVSTAKTDEVNNAAKAFRWALDTEKRLVVMLQKSLTAIRTGKGSSLPKVYHICPKCGNVYDVANPEKSCAFCSTERSRFIKFGR